MTSKILPQKSLFDAQILVVDDTPANLRLLGDIFRERGYKIRLVRDGELAIQSALVEPPDLILLDIMMPEIDGYEVCSRLKANPKTKNVPVIFMSAKGEVFDKIKAFSLGGVDYITKPFAAEEVVVRIENQLRIWQRSKEVLEQNHLLQEELQELQRLEMELKNRGDLSRLRVNLVPQGPSGDRSCSGACSLLKPVSSETSVLETQCLVVTPETTLEDSITRMSQMRVSCALVAKKEKLAGILTERDIVKITAENLQLENIKVGQVMTVDPIAITLSAELDLFSILSLMRQHRIRHLPAVDRAGKVLGVITQSSIREVLQPIDLKLKRVREVMIAKVVCGNPASSLWEIAKMMATQNISCVVITQSENGSDVVPVGIITELDIVQFRALGVDLLSTLAGEVTIAPLLSVGVEDSLWEAHKLMERHCIPTLVAVSDGGSLAGIITGSSLLDGLEPVEVYSTLERLRLQVDRRIVQLNQANDRLQQEIALREKALSQRELLERQLMEQNTRLQEEVSHRILAEKTLSKREGELRALVENAPDAILRLDRQLRYLYVNGKFTRDVGKSSAEILGKTIRELSTTKHLTSPWEKAVGEVFNTGEEREIEFEALSTAGIKYYSARVVPEWGDNGEVETLLAVVRDVSDRKRAEIERERLLESERAAREEAEAARTRATDILESIGDAFFTLDKDWKFTYVNRQAEFLLHRKRSELMGRIVWEEFPEAVGSNFERQYRRVVSQQVKSEFVEFYPPLDAWFEVRAFPGKEGISVYFQDVSDRVAAETALRNSEHFLRSIYEGAETAIFIVDVGENGEFRYVGLNPAQERFSGLKDSELKGKTPEEALPAAAAKKVSERYRACTEARERMGYEECLHLHGKETWWITNLTPLFDSSNRVYRLIGTCFNITDRKRSEIATSREMRRDRLVGTIQDRIRSSLNLEEILTTAAEEIRKFLKSDRVLIYQVLPGQVKVAIVESVEADVTPIWEILPEEVLPQETYELYRRGEVFVIEDIDTTEASPRQTLFLRRSGIQAKLGIPILKDGELWGLIAVHQCGRARRWQGVEIESLKQIAVQLAIGIQQSTLYSLAQAEIWERQAAEKALRESKRFVQNIADTSPNLLYIFDLEEQRNIYSNREIAKVLGYTSEEIKDMGDRILPTIIHPEDLAKLPEHHQKWATAKDGDILDLEYRLKNSKEEWRYIFAKETVFSRTKEGKAKQILGTASDITTLKQTETALREAADREKTLAVAFQRMRQSLDMETIFSATTEELRFALGCERVAIYRFDADYSGEYVAESVAAEELAVASPLGGAGRSLRTQSRQDCRLDTLLKSPQKWHDSYLKESQGSHLKSADAYCLVVRDIYEANFSGCYLERLEEFKIRAYIIVPIFCGRELWGLLAAYECSRPRQWKTSDEKIATEIGNQLGVALQQAELLEQTKKQSEALERAAIAADGANRAKSEFLASMSHELRTPLNAILGFTQLMTRDRSLATQHQQQLKIIDRAGEHLLALINDILEMSKIEAGRTTLNPTCFNLTAMLESLESMLRLKAQSKGLQLIFDMAPGLPQVIETDEGKLRQVLINILGNAIKFTKSGGANLRVKAETDNLPEVKLLFEIEDTGPGIAPEEMDRLFEPFAQTQTGRGSQQGTGLGLPISRKFVQLMGGDIRASSVFAKGTVFAFDIPVTVADTADLVGEPSRGRAIALREGTGERRILVVDDQDHNRQFLVALLAAIGFEVREAGNGREALSLWSSWEPHLILMDMRMPVMDGYEATKSIKATPKGKATTVIALTASAFEEDRQKILGAGCDDLVRKPFREEVLLGKIGDRLGIEYIYEGNDGESLELSQTPEKTVTTSDIIEYLSQMPQDWVAEVRDAASQGTDDAILELLERVPESLSLLASALGDLAHNFQFEAIMELTQQEQK